MKTYKFIVPIRCTVDMEVKAENEEEAKRKIIAGEIVHEGFAEIDTWYTERAILCELEKE